MTNARFASACASWRRRCIASRRAKKVDNSPSRKAPPRQFNEALQPDTFWRRFARYQSEGQQQAAAHGQIQKHNGDDVMTTENPNASAQPLPPDAVLLQMAFAPMVAQALYVAA